MITLLIDSQYANEGIFTEINCAFGLDKNNYNL